MMARIPRRWFLCAVIGWLLATASRLEASPLAFVTSGVKGEVVVVDLASDRVTQRIAVGKDPRAITLRADKEKFLFRATERPGLLVIKP